MRFVLSQAIFRYWQTNLPCKYFDPCIFGFLQQTLCSRVLSLTARPRTFLFSGLKTVWFSCLRLHAASNNMPGPSVPGCLFLFPTWGKTAYTVSFILVGLPGYQLLFHLCHPADFSFLLLFCCSFSQCSHRSPRVFCWSTTQLNRRVLLSSLQKELHHATWVENLRGCTVCTFHPLHTWNQRGCTRCLWRHQRQMGLETLKTDWSLACVLDRNFI